MRSPHDPETPRRLLTMIILSDNRCPSVPHPRATGSAPSSAPASTGPADRCPTTPPTTGGRATARRPESTSRSTSYGTPTPPNSSTPASPPKPPSCTLSSPTTSQTPRSAPPADAATAADLHAHCSTRHYTQPRSISAPMAVPRFLNPDPAGERERGFGRGGDGRLVPRLPRTAEPTRGARSGRRPARGQPAPRPGREAQRFLARRRRGREPVAAPPPGAVTGAEHQPAVRRRTDSPGRRLSESCPDTWITDSRSTERRLPGRTARDSLWLFVRQQLSQSAALAPTRHMIMDFSRRPKRSRQKTIRVSVAVKQP